MSWPRDGKPRFTLAVTEGILQMPILAGGKNESANNNRKPHATYAILDRANCHREVALFRTEDLLTRGKSIAEARKRVADVARTRLDELNGVGSEEAA